MLKIRFLEPANEPYRKSFKNLYVYNKYIRTPSNGLLILATIVKKHFADVFCYSESISKLLWNDILDANIVFISIFTFNANRGYELASRIRENSKATVVMGGLHATLNYEEASQYCDYILLGEGDDVILPFIDAVLKNKEVTMPGVAYRRDGQLIYTGMPITPQNIDVIPDRSLLYQFKRMAGHNTIWPQVHASRGCPHNCDYCALVAAFGRKIRLRPPENIVEDIRQAIRFYDDGHNRLARILWITDDNFFADRAWAIRVLNCIIDSGIQYYFAIQARYEVGFDDEILYLLKRAGFAEIAMGIEFLEDSAFEQYNKKSTYLEILRSVKNIQEHGLRVRGLFIVGADNHTTGVGERVANFVIDNDICGALIQSMYFIPGTPVYSTHKDRLLNHDWSRCVGKVVHYPQNISPYALQQEIITASKRIYSLKRLLRTILHKDGIERILFVGEYFWQKSVRKDLRKELPFLKQFTNCTCVNLQNSTNGVY